MDDPDQLRAAAIKRLQAKRGFRVHALVYAVVNAMLLIDWAMMGHRYFWPIWPMAGWGIGLAIHGWTVYFERPISEGEIRREIEKQKASL
jgi:2TM domain